MSPSPRPVQDLARDSIRRELFSTPDEAQRKEAERRNAIYAEQQFVGRFNRLLQVLQDFASHYNANHAIDLKRIKAVKRAWRDLENSEAWFKQDARK